MVSYLNLLPLYEELARGVHSYTVICYYGWGTCHFTDADTKIKGVRIGDQKIKQ